MIAADAPGDDAAAVEAEVRRLMWEKAGLVRSRQGLESALARLTFLAGRRRLAGPTVNLLTVARLVATAALARPESRGAHFRSDHPVADPAWRRRILLSPQGGELRVESEPVGDESVERCA